MRTYNSDKRAEDGLYKLSPVEDASKILRGRIRNNVELTIRRRTCPACVSTVKTPQPPSSGEYAPFFPFLAPPRQEIRAPHFDSISLDECVNITGFIMSGDSSTLPLVVEFFELLCPSLAHVDEAVVEMSNIELSMPHLTW